MKILFVCHGNICRSVMAEYIFKKMTDNKIACESRATSTEEIGNDIYPPVKKILDKHNIPYSRHYARQIIENDYNNSDLLVVFDFENYRILKNRFNDEKNKIHLIKEYINENNEVSDPWYTRDFETCYQEIYKCVKELINTLL